MKNAVLLATFIATCTSQIFSQQNYSVSWGESSYDTLEDFTSIMYDVFPYPSISGEEIEINFGFNFPFFDSIYDSVILDGDGLGYFPNAADYNLFLFTGEFENHMYSGLPIYSDWRYKTDTINGIGLLKVEWRNIGIYDDVTDPFPSDGIINFQVWFFENGIIEIHFGEVDLANSQYYSDMNGFIWDDGESYGPWIGIANLDLTEVYYVTGTNDTINVVNMEDDADIFYSIPIYGQFFRFTPNEVSNLLEEEYFSKEVYVYPNPVTTDFTIRFGNEVKNTFSNMMLQINDASGNLVKSKLINENAIIDITEFPTGMYFIRLSDDKFDTLTKIIKN